MHEYFISVSPSPTNPVLASVAGLGPHAATPVSVLEYEDYHVFLRDWVASKKRERSSFSYQELADRIGLKSKSSLRLVCMGDRDLSPSAAVKFVVAMGLDERETEYFLALVAFNNASDPKERDLYFGKLNRFSKQKKKTVLSAQEFDFFSKWYIIPLWEMVAARPFGGDFKALGQMLEPAISSEDARHALKVLLDLRLIEPEGDRYVQRSENLQTREELISKTIKGYQRETLELAGRALDAVALENRHISTVTIGLDAENWKRAKDLIAEFRQKLVDLSGGVQGVDRVYQINIQAFPFTRIPS